MSAERRLDLKPLESALAQFDLAISEFSDEPERRAHRDSVALHFMIVWNLLFPAIIRYLELQSIDADEIPELSFQTLIRRADAAGMLQTGWPEFGKFRDARNAVAHMYDLPRANLIVQAAPDFAREAQSILATLKRRLNNGGN